MSRKTLLKVAIKLRLPALARDPKALTSLLDVSRVIATDHAQLGIDFEAEGIAPTFCRVGQASTIGQTRVTRPALYRVSFGLLTTKRQTRAQVLNARCARLVALTPRFEGQRAAVL